jgi:hypothetical protein
MRLNERSMRRIADDLHVEEQAAAAASRRRWSLDQAPAGIIPVGRVRPPTSWITRIWRVATHQGTA